MDYGGMKSVLLRRIGGKNEPPQSREGEPFTNPELHAALAEVPDRYFGACAEVVPIIWRSMEATLLPEQQWGLDQVCLSYGYENTDRAVDYYVVYTLFMASRVLALTMDSDVAARYAIQGAVKLIRAKQEQDDPRDPFPRADTIIRIFCSFEDFERALSRKFGVRNILAGSDDTARGAILSSIFFGTLLKKDTCRAEYHPNASTFIGVAYKNIARAIRASLQEA
jgi:hypothetical protein